MHCQVCDCLLTDEESVRKNEDTGDYWDLCGNCIANLWFDINDVYFDSEPTEPIFLPDQETDQ